MGLLLVAALVGGLVLHGDARTLVVDGLGLLAVWMSSWVCWLAVWRVGFRYGEVLLSAAAVVAQAAGLTYLAVVVAGGGSVPLPSPADVGFLLFYPLMLTALVVAVRHHSWGLASSVWLDCAVGSLGAASVLAVVLSPVRDSATAGPQSLATVVAVAYPMVGLLIFATADVVYALQRTTDTYVVGTPLDVGWAIGLALVAMWVDSTARSG